MNKLKTQVERWLILLCFALLSFFSAQVVKAQRSPSVELIPLRNYTMEKGIERRDGILSYFYDKDHELDKFVGVWEGTSWNGYQLRAELSLAKKYDKGEYMVDLLVLDLRVSKDGRPVPSYLELDKKMNRVLGFQLVLSSKIPAASHSSLGYSIPLSYGDGEEPPYYYNGWHSTTWAINDAGDAITVWTKFLGSIESLPRFPEYAVSRRQNAPIWTLHRVK